MTIDETRRSPHFNARPYNGKPTGILLHADGGASDEGTVGYLCDPASKVSYHYFIGRTGKIWELVEPEKRAWHAGYSAAGGRRGCNDFTIGVAFANNQKGELFTESQIAAGVALVRALRKAYGIPLHAIWTHEQVSEPEGRKVDPGPLFPLARFLTAVRTGA